MQLRKHVEALCGCLCVITIPAQVLAVPSTPPLLRVVVPPLLNMRGAGGELVDPAVLAKLNNQFQQIAEKSRFVVVPWDTTPNKISAPDPSLIAKLNEVRQALRELRLDQAVQMLNASIDTMEQNTTAADYSEHLLSAHLLLASAYHSMQESTLAVGELTKVARMRPGLELNPREHAPNFIEAFGTAKAQIFAEQKGELDIDLGVSGVNVLIDNLGVGSAPLTVSVFKGVHFLRVSHPGFEPLLQTLRVQSGGHYSVHQTLTRTPMATVVDEMLAGIESATSREDALKKVNNVSLAANTDAVLVTGAAPLSKGIALVAMLSTTPPRTIVGTFTKTHQRAHLVMSSMLNRLFAQKTVQKANRIELISGEQPALGLVGVKVSFKKRLLGIFPGAPKIKQAHPPAGSTDSGIAMGNTQPKASSSTILSSPWLWGGVGTVVVGTAVALGIVLSKHKTGPTTTLPDTLTIGVGTP